MLLLTLSLAWAEVTAAEAGGFVVRHEAESSLLPDALWPVLVDPKRWWSSDHTFTGDAANLSLVAEAGGCWCERAPGVEVRHLTVVFAERGKVLRLQGGLGPLQAMAVQGTLTMTLEPAPKGTKVALTYAVGGFHPGGLQASAAPVDQVLGEQLTSLVRVR